MKLWLLLAPALALVISGCFDAKSDSPSGAAKTAPLKSTATQSSPSTATAPPVATTTPIQTTPDIIIDICDRGAVGSFLSTILKAESCHKVSSNQMANLKTLDLREMVSWGNVDILPDSFVGLTSLTALDLGYNAHEGGVRNGRVTLHRGTFHGLVSLQKLSLRATWTTGLPVGVFEGLSSLKELNMWAFDPAAPLVPGVFQGLDSLETLDLSSYRSHEGYSTDGDMKFHTTHPDKAALVPNLFTGLRSLKQFDLSDCNLRSIQPGVFKGLDQLQILDISGNYFESIPAGTFSGLPNLTDLSLNGDSPAAWLSYDENGILNMQMAVIQPGAFQGLIALKHLDLKLSAFSVFSKSAAGLRSDVNVECEHGAEWPNGVECVE